MSGGVSAPLPFIVEAHRRRKNTATHPIFRKTLFSVEKHKVTMASLAQRLGVSLFSLYISVLAIFLNRWSSFRTVTIGIAVSNRETVPGIDQIGCSIISTVPVVVPVEHDGGPSLKAVASRAAHAVLAAMDNILPLSDIAEATGVGNPEGLNGLFQVVMVGSPSITGGSLAGDSVDPVASVAGTQAMLPIALRLMLDGGMRSEFEFDGSMFADDWATAFARQFDRLVEAVATSAADTSVLSLPIFNDADKRRLIRDWNEGTLPADQHVVDEDTVHSLVMQARTTVGDVAPAVLDPSTQQVNIGHIS